MLSPDGGASLLDIIVSTPTRRGHPFVPTKGCKSGLGLRPKNPVALLRWIQIWIFRSRKIQIRTARRWASKVPAAHFYRRCAGAQNGEPPPLSPPRRRGTMGRESKYFLICKLWYLQAADPWLWLAGLSVCRKREGVSLPRSGGGWEGADASAIPYKHRLAHDPGGRRPSGRAFRCVGFSGRSPE